MSVVKRFFGFYNPRRLNARAIYFGVVQSYTIDFSDYDSGQYVVFAGDDVIRVTAYGSSIAATTYVSSGTNTCDMDITGMQLKLTLVRSSMISMIGMTHSVV